jgi:hypothetical protein
VKSSLAVAALVAGLLALPARGVITVDSIIDNAESPTGIRAQAVIKEATDGATQFAQSIKEFRALITVRDSEFNNALLVRKHQLPASDAWGQGRPLGYQQPPFTDPEGPWQGLVWPFRDQYDYFAGPKDPLADDVGTFFQDGNLYGFSNIVGIARGGPTEPNIPPPGQPTPQWLLRGIPGNGLEAPTTYFNFDVIPLFGPPDRAVQITISAASAVVVQRSSAGAYSEITVPVATRTFTVRLPEPGAMALFPLAFAAALRRRRGRSFA